MTLTPTTIKPGKRVKKNVKRVGRGNASGKGTYSAKGMKGQKARSGNKNTAIRALKQRLQKVPKLRGFKSQKIKPETVSLVTLNRIAVEGKEVTPRFLKQKSAIKHPEHGVKIVAGGEIDKKIICRGCLASKTAQEKIEKIGGKIIF